VPLPSRHERGYSLVELLLVLAIMGILAGLGVSMLGNRAGSGVRGLTDTLEGCLAEAHRATSASGRDMSIVTWGTWDPAAPLALAYGDAALTNVQIQTTAQGLMASPVILANPATLPYSQTVAVPFSFSSRGTTDPVLRSAHIALANSGDWGTAMQALASGQQNQDITTVTPFGAGQIFNGVVTDANNLFSAAGAVNQTLISGFTRRFTTPFIIEIVAQAPNGLVLAGGAMGLLVVQANGNSIYKFYNPGVLHGDGKWRRI